MADLPTKKVCLYNDNEEGIDRISDLPDPVLCHVLSFLPTKMSVATSVLSKRWINLWTTVPALSFSFTEFSDRFVDSVYKVLAMFQAQTIHQFSLDFEHISGVDDEHIDTWISAAIKRNVQELILKLNLCAPYGPPFKLHDYVFAYKTLVCLRLFDDVFVDVPANACLPSLKILQLERDDNILDLDINVPSLKRISVKSPSSTADTCKLLINAPLLERIGFFDEMICDFEVEDLPNLVEAIFFVDGTQKLIKKASKVKFLSLSEDAYVSLFYDVKLPVFCNLVCLEITTSCEYWCGLTTLLKYSDNLKTLVFHIKVPSYHIGCTCDESLSEIVPKFMSLSLKTLRLTGFCNLKCNWELVRYVLKNAWFLKQMKVGTSLEKCHMKNLLKYPRASMSCEISFFNDLSGQEFQL
ncbi:hypothetical protein V6N13_079214 [Hibiscus sabdariffa]